MAWLEGLRCEPFSIDIFSQDALFRSGSSFCGDDRVGRLLSESGLGAAEHVECTTDCRTVAG